MSQSIKINTTQNVSLDYEVATLGDRVAAAIIDQVIIFGWWIIINIIFSYLKWRIDTSVYVILQLFPLLYHLLFEVFNNGRSPGKMIMKTRVVRTDGTEPVLGNYIIRWLLGLIEVVATSGGIALVAYLINGKGQRLGDMAAGTTVAKVKQRVTLQQTIFEETGEEYMVAYPEAEQLSDTDIETIKEVIYVTRRYYTVETILLIEKTRKTVETRLNIKGQETESMDFLKRVIKDYNHITGRTV